MMLREKIQFIRVTATQSDTGELVNTESVFYSPKGASVKEITPSNDTIIGQDAISMLIEVVIRYNPSVIIRIGDKIEWRGFRFNALSPKVDALRRWVTIKAFSEMENTDRSGNAGEVDIMEEIPLEL